MAKSLSHQQALALHVIRTYIAQKGFPPTVREIGERMGLSAASTVHSHLIRLEEKGYITRGDGARMIRINQVAVPAGSRS